jgi:ABC-type transport system substrate-binding protein
VTVDIVPQVRLVGDVLDGRAFDMALTAVDNGPDPDIYVFWHSSEMVAGGINFSGMAKDVFLDKNLEDAPFSADQEVRHDAYAAAQKILREAQPAVFLFTPEVLLAATYRLQWVRLYPGGRDQPALRVRPG